MGVDRTTIKRSAGLVTFGGANLYPESEIGVDYAPDFDDVVAWAYGRVDECKKDFKIPVKLRLWGAYENLSVLFPAAAMTPVPGTSLCSDATLQVWAKNGDKVIFQNAFISKLPDIYIGVDKNVWSADVEFMCLLKTGKAPEDADGYFVRSNASFTDPGPFAKTNFMRRRATLAWGAKTGFTSFEMREGVQIGFKYDIGYDMSPNWGTDNVYIGQKGLTVELKGIPAGPTLAQSDVLLPGQAVAHGALLSDISADLVATFSGTGSHAVTVKNAGLTKVSEFFDVKKLRSGEHIWRSTTGISAGVAAAVGVVA